MNESHQCLSAESLVRTQGFRRGSLQSHPVTNAFRLRVWLGHGVAHPLCCIRSLVTNAYRLRVWLGRDYIAVVADPSNWSPMPFG